MTWTALDQRRRSEGASPLVTHLGPDGRMELSATSVANAAAKIGNALRDAFELEPGQRVGLFLPLHWQRATWLAGIWTAGCVACPDARDVDLVVGTLDRVPSGTETETAIVSMHPFGLPLGEPLPEGAHDASLIAQQQPDAYLFDTPMDAVVLEVEGRRLTSSAAMSLAAERADAWGLRDRGRLLVTSTVAPVDSWLALLPMPLVVNGSVVLSEAAPTVAISEQERITAFAQ